MSFSFSKINGLQFYYPHTQCDLELTATSAESLEAKIDRCENMLAVFSFALLFNTAEVFLFIYSNISRAKMSRNNVAKLEQEMKRSGKSQGKVEQCSRSPPRVEVLLHPSHVGLMLLPLTPLVLRHQGLRGDGGRADALRKLVCASARQHHVRRLKVQALSGVQKGLRSLFAH